MSAEPNSITGIVRRATLMVFICAIILGAGAFYFFFTAASMRHVEDEARALLRVAMATREYTADSLSPLLVDMSGETFNVESVPSYTAQSVFRRMTDDKSGYLYREAALNPTNPNDLATEFEAELIRRFRNNPELMETQGINWDDRNPTFYLARPIQITDQVCLACHSDPASAPPAMLAQYGSENGFNWQHGEIIGVQLLTVPVKDEYRSIIEMVAIFAAMLVILFFVVALMVTLPLKRNVIQPIKRLVEVAERSSLRNDETEVPVEGAGEIRSLSEAINRLRASLALSMKGKGQR